MYMMLFRVVLMPAMLMLSFFTGWRMATRLIVDECQRFGGFVSGKKEFRCISTMQMWLMHECPNHRIYIAGPMTGLPDNNYPAFHDAAARLRKRAWHVENPAENPRPHVDADCNWTAYMRMGADLAAHVCSAGANGDFVWRPGVFHLIPTKGDVPTIGHGATHYEDGTRVTMADAPITRQRARELAINLLNDTYVACVQRSLGDTLMHPVEFDQAVDFAGQFGCNRWWNSAMRKNYQAGRRSHGAKAAHLQRWHGWQSR